MFTSWNEAVGHLLPFPQGLDAALVDPYALLCATMVILLLSVFRSMCIGHTSVQTLRHAGLRQQIYVVWCWRGSVPLHSSASSKAQRRLTTSAGRVLVDAFRERHAKLQPSGFVQSRRAAATRLFVLLHLRVQLHFNSLQSPTWISRPCTGVSLLRRRQSFIGSKKLDVD